MLSVARALLWIGQGEMTMSKHDQLTEIDSKDLANTTGGAGEAGGEQPGFPRPTGPTFPRPPQLPGGGQRPCLACGMG